MIPDQKKDEAEAIDIVEQTQDYSTHTPIISDEIRVGDKVIHTNLYISVCRGSARERARAAVYECIGVTPRSITTRPWGSNQKYGSQFERRYIKRAE